MNCKSCSSNMNRPRHLILTIGSGPIEQVFNYIEDLEELDGTTFNSWIRLARSGLTAAMLFFYKRISRDSQDAG